MPASPARGCALNPGIRRYLSTRFDIDFVSLTYTRDGADVREARRVVRECGLLETKIIAKVRRRGSR